MWLVSQEKTINGEKPKSSDHGFEILTSFSDRFPGDKCRYLDESRFIICDGVLLNKRDLTDRHPDFVRYLIHSAENDELFFSKFKGPFTGCHYNKRADTFIAYGNQTGDASIFCYFDGLLFAVSSDFNMLFEWCLKKGKNLSYNPAAVNHMLTLGYLAEGNTVASEIYLLEPGDYIKFQNGNIQYLNYFHFRFGDYFITEMDEAVEKTDDCFRRAVKLCFEKDLEYGYQGHLVDLSGGLDSRMTNWVARDLGYKNILNICYAQKDSNEERFAGLVSGKLGNTFRFDPLDNAEFIYDIEKLVKMNYGLSVYAGITGGERLLASLDYKKFGLEHTGQLGDGVLSYKENVIRADGTINTDSVAYSTIIKPKLKNAKKYKNGEEFAFYYRFSRGALASHYIRRNYTEAVSPFIDIDFAQLCFNISPDLRANHRLYLEWIKRKYPDALSIPSTKSQVSLRMKIYHMIPAGLGRSIIRFCKRTGLTGLISDKRGMNPFDLWYEKNSDMKTFIDEYYQKHICLFSIYPDEKRQLETVMAGERTMDKLLVLTVLGAYKVYFGRDHGENV